MHVSKWVYNTTLKAGASVLQVERTASSSQWKHCQMSYAVWLLYDIFLYEKHTEHNIFSPWPNIGHLLLGCWAAQAAWVLEEHWLHIKVWYPCSWFAVVPCFSVAWPCIWLASLTDQGIWSHFLDTASCWVVGGCLYMEACLWPPDLSPWLW